MDILAILFPPRRLPAFQRSPVPEMKAGGCTVAWSTVPVVTEVTHLDSGLIARPGDRYIERGTILVQQSAGGKYGPADSAATDGRENWSAPVRSRVCIQNVTVLESEPGSDHPPVATGGVVRRSALKIGGAGQPTLAQFLAMFPNVTFDSERDG